MICKAMKRLTTDTPKGCLEGMLNFAIAKDNKVFLADENGEYNVDLCEYVSKLAKAKGYDFSPEDIMEEGLFEYYQEDFAVLYCLAVQAAELRSRLKMFEDKLKNGTLIELPCKVGGTVFVTPNGKDFYKAKLYGKNENGTYFVEVYATFIGIPLDKPFYDWHINTYTKEEAEARLKELQNG